MWGCQLSYIHNILKFHTRYTNPGSYIDWLGSRERWGRGREMGTLHRRDLPVLPHLIQKHGTEQGREGDTYTAQLCSYPTRALYTPVLQYTDSPGDYPRARCVAEWAVGGSGIIIMGELIDMRHFLHVYNQITIKIYMNLSTKVIRLFDKRIIIRYQFKFFCYNKFVVILQYVVLKTYKINL